MVQETTSTGTTYTSKNEQTDFNSLVEKYMQLDKKTLAELLALKEWQEQAQPQFPSHPTYPSYPTYPTYPSIPTNPWPWVTWCERCTNPFHDCIGCPYHNSTGFPREVQANIKYTTNTTADIK